MVKSLTTRTGPGREPPASIRGSRSHAKDSVPNPTDLLIQLRSAECDVELLRQASALERAWTRKQSRDDYQYLRVKCVVAEIYDHFGQYERAKRAIEDDGLRARAILSSSRPGSESLDRTVWKWRIWVLLNYAQTAFRNGSYSDCRDLLQDCQRAIDHLDGNVPATFGTRARLQYILGQAHRQLNDLDQAKNAFRLAIEYADNHLRTKLSQHESLERRRREIGLADWTVAKCLAFGLGWISYKRGQLSTAEPLIAAGRTLFRSTGDRILQAYAELLSCAISRARGGRDRRRLTEVIPVLEDVREVFGQFRHNVFRSRAAYELALAYMYLGEFERARTRLSEFRKTAEQRNDQHALCNALVLESRILRHEQRLEEAAAIAQSAAALAEKTSERLLRIEALISSGEIETDKGRQQALGGLTPENNDYFARARDFLTQALRLAENNAKLRAVCFVHLARAYTLIRDYPRAQSWMRQYEDLKPHVESGFVHDLANDVYLELRKSDFVIGASNVENLDYGYWSEQLRDFLLRQARNAFNGGTQGAVAEKLGISRQTLHLWEKSKTKNRR